MWGTDELVCLSRYDGLQYFRLNPLGAYCLGLAETWEPSLPAARTSLTIFPDRRLHASAPPATDERLMLETWAHPESDDVWRLDRDRTLAAVEGGHAVDDLRTFLAARDDQPLPETVEGFLRDVERRARALESRGTALLLECADAEVAERLATDARTAKLCLRAGAVYLLLNPAYPEREVDYFLGDAEPRLVVARSESAGRVAGLCGRHGIGEPLTLGTGDDGTLTEASRSMPNRFDTVERASGDLAAKNGKYNWAICVDGGVVVWRCGGGSVVVVRFVVGASAGVVAVERAMMRGCQEGGGPRVGSARGVAAARSSAPATAARRWWATPRSGTSRGGRTRRRSTEWCAGRRRARACRCSISPPDCGFAIPRPTGSGSTKLCPNPLEHLQGRSTGIAGEPVCLESLVELSALLVGDHQGLLFFRNAVPDVLYQPYSVVHGDFTNLHAILQCGRWVEVYALAADGRSPVRERPTPSHVTVSAPRQASLASRVQAAPAASASVLRRCRW